MRKLIVNADDFGLARSVNEAILEGFLRGNISSTTMMVNMPGTEHASALSRAHPGLSVGLHFCLTEGRPVTRCPSLTGADGRFVSWKTLILRASTWRVSLDEVRGELEAQMVRLESLGVHVRHLDSHQHVHMHPRLFPVVAEAAERLRLPIRLVWPASHSGTLPARPFKELKQALLRRSSESYFRHLKVKSNDCLVAVHDLPDPNAFTASSYLELLRAAEDRAVVEVMVHPYILGKDVLDLYSDSDEGQRVFLAKCEREHQILSAGRIFGSADGFEMTTYAAL